MASYPTDVVLAALDFEPTREQMRLFWNSKEEDDLLADPAVGERCWLGTTDAGKDVQPGPAGAVGTLLFLMGTLPDYKAPRLTSELESLILWAYDRAVGDGWPCVQPETLRAFLEDHLGCYLVTEGCPSQRRLGRAAGSKPPDTTNA
ncbi:hypothetical protein [Nocardioides sp. MH1]|uniref:hypothetical protein n=1 Tax=Nocardioides sp. MH1 TaxID=3242490 RepID=UPI00352138B1